MATARSSYVPRTISFVIAFCLICTTSQAKYSGGTGEPNDPYQIATAEDLVLLGNSPEDYDKHFILTADIDLDPNLPGRKVFDRAVIAPDTDMNTSEFHGIAFTGVFDGNSHTISHLTIVGINYLGLFGRLESGATVRDIGLLYANITGSGDFVGGLAGLNGYSNLAECYYSIGSISGNWYVGGLVGRNFDGTIIHCYSTGLVGGENYIGGLAGNNNGDVIGCYSTGSIGGRRRVGGLVGDNSGGDLILCYSIGLVSGFEKVGGLVGYGGTVTKCFWNIQTSHQTSSAGGTGKTTAQMMDIRTFLDAGWDFLGEIENGLYETWQMPQSGGYPVLSIFNDYYPPVLPGEGSPESPYLISTAAELASTIYQKKNSCYRLTQDINLSGITWPIAPIPHLAGVFDGHGYIISNLTIAGQNYLGLIGKIQDGGQVWNLGVEEANVNGTGNFIGIIVGYNTGHLLSSYSNGLVCGGDFVGGLVGGNEGVVTECYSNTSVSGNISIGGLVGSLGSNSSEVTHCFWDIETSGQTRSAGGMGKTTAEMRMTSTYLEAGWDFVDETENGTDDTWWIPEGQDYPKLRQLPKDFRLQTLPAFYPDPRDGIIDLIQTPILSWAPSDPTIQHDIYFGEGKKKVINATMESLGVYRGRQPGELTTYETGLLEWNKTYFWRIDEVGADMRISKGYVWSFTTANFIVVDDIEDYTDFPPNEIWNTWIDGWDDPENGAIVGYTDIDFIFGEHYVETKIVHGGRQSMPYFYDNTVASYSEATMTLVWPRDWTHDGVGVLSLWYHGRASNDAEQMYVAIANIGGEPAAIYYDDPDTLLVEDWIEWTTDLTNFSDQGVDLTDVDTISIGFGDKNNPEPGGEGLVFFDDIRLYRPSAFEPTP